MDRSTRRGFLPFAWRRRQGSKLLIGYTRLGILLGLLDREDIPEIQEAHRSHRGQAFLSLLRLANDAKKLTYANYLRNGVIFGGPSRA